MPVSTLIGKPTTYPVAGRPSLVQMAVKAREQYTLFATNNAVVEAHSKKVVTALNTKANARLRLVADLENALWHTDDALIRAARQAVMSAADLFLTIAVHPRAPQLIGSATGVDLVLDTAEFVIQILHASDDTTQQKAIVILSNGRWSTIHSLVTGPGELYTNRQFGVATALTDAMSSLTDAVFDQTRLRSALTAAHEAVINIETQSAGLPDDHAQWRQFILNQLDAEIFLFELLTSEYAETGCRIDTAPRLL